jgi:hypothetical protein
LKYTRSISGSRGGGGTVLSSTSNVGVISVARDFHFAPERAAREK